MENVQSSSQQAQFQTNQNRIEIKRKLSTNANHMANLQKNLSSNIMKMNKGRNFANLQALKTVYNNNFKKQLLRRVQGNQKDHLRLKTISPPNLAQSQA